MPQFLKALFLGSYLSLCHISLELPQLIEPLYSIANEAHVVAKHAQIYLVHGQLLVEDLLLLTDTVAAGRFLVALDAANRASRQKAARAFVLAGVDIANLANFSRHYYY